MVAKSPNADSTRSRVKQLQRDRLLTRAISLYARDHRVKLLPSLRSDKDMQPGSRGKSEKDHKELLRVARAKFHREPEDVRDAHIKRAAALLQGVDVVQSVDSPIAQPARGQGVGGSRPSRRLRSKTVDGQWKAPACKTSAGPSSLSSGGPKFIEARTPVAQRPPMTTTSPACWPKASDQEAHAADQGLAIKFAQRQGVRGSAGPARLPADGPEAAVRDKIVASMPTLVTLYGDAGAAEVLGASLRLMDRCGSAAFGESPFAGRSSDRASGAAVEVRAAVVLGVGVKLTMTADDASVANLWAKVAGRGLVHQVRSLEPKALAVWAPMGLELGTRDYMPAASSG